MASSSVIHSTFPLPSLPIQASDSARMALENCITRIRLVVQQVRLGILNEPLSKFNCPITGEFPENPVLTNCGHIFDRAAIQRWKNLGKPCALCRTPLTQFTPIHALREFVEDRLLKDLVLTCSSFKGPNESLAAKCLEIARSCTDERNYEGALGFLTQALQYTNLSADYAVVPGLYDQLKAPGKALLSRLFLSLYQLQEGRIQEAVETLKHCESKGLNVSSSIVGLTLQLCQSPKTVDWAMTRALNQNNSSDSIFIYKQIIAHVPDHLDAYKPLISLIKDQTEKKNLLLKAADLAHKVQQFDLEANFHSEVEILLVPTIISKAGWADSKTISLPTYPQELTDFLAGNCTIWPGKKRSETHIVVPLFPEVAINNTPIPLTLESLDQLDKSSGGPGLLYNQFPENIPVEKKFCYAVMTSDVIPGSRNKPYNDQLRLLPPGYEAPGVFDAARAILWENRRSGKRCFKNQWTYTSTCDFKWIVGNFDPSGLTVSPNVFALHAYVGIAGWRKFLKEHESILTHVGAVCSNTARTDLCRVSHPYHNQKENFLKRLV